MPIVPPAPDESVVLEGLSWKEFENILAELGEIRGRRVAYENGRLEIMSPSEIHERIAEILGLFLHILTEEYGLEIASMGSWTLQSPGLHRAVEGDKTFYIKNEARIRDVDRLDLKRDPPPDLVLEVDVTRKSIDRFPIYAAFRVPEIWRFTNGILEVHQLRGTTYERTDTSLSFPGFPVIELARFVELGLRGAAGENQLAREFRGWVREKLQGH